jgi:lipopolysaccharide export system protein LptA
MKILVYLFIFSFTLICAQENSNKLKITGDSLKGKVINGQNVREVIGNVVITQEDVKITCNKAVQYIADNNADLIGNVIITQDSVIIKTERGKYFGVPNIAYSDSAVHLNNGELDLKADIGNYNLDTKVANFFGNVNFRDSLTNLFSQKLTYKKDIEKVIAVGSVIVTDTVSTIKADSLIHLRNTKLSEGYRNIIIESMENNLTIFGDTLYDDKRQNFSKITGDPFLTQIEKLNDGTYDTLFIKSKILESRNDSSESLYAIDSVKIIRGSFFSDNDFTIYDRLMEQITILRQEDKSSPVLWYENSQIVGDSVFINLDSSKISSIDIFSNAIIFSQDSTYEFRFDQMSGDSIHLSFRNSRLAQTKVNGNVLSIYYMYEEKEPNGLLKSSANEITINFEYNKVNEVKMYGSPISEYHPENLVINNEKSFTLPAFYIYSNKPDKSEFKAIFSKYKLK